MQDVSQARERSCVSSTLVGGMWQIRVKIGSEGVVEQVILIKN